MFPFPEKLSRHHHRILRNADWMNQFSIIFPQLKNFSIFRGETPWKCYLKPHLSQARCLANAARLERLALTCEKASIVPFNAHRLWKLYVWPWP